MVSALWLSEEYFQSVHVLFPRRHCRRQICEPIFFTTYVTINTNIFHKILFINYCSDRFRPQFLAIFRELFVFSMFAAYVSTYLAAFYIIL
jgi:hypothetical protein